ncbi:MAG: hypothetical protein ACRAVC_13135 [Trichormus sp.]
MPNAQCPMPNSLNPIPLTQFLVKDMPQLILGVLNRCQLCLI